MEVIYKYPRIVEQIHDVINEASANQRPIERIVLHPKEMADFKQFLWEHGGAKGVYGPFKYKGITIEEKRR